MHSDTSKESYRVIPPTVDIYYQHHGKCPNHAFLTTHIDIFYSIKRHHLPSILMSISLSNRTALSSYRNQKSGNSDNLYWHYTWHSVSIQFFKQDDFFSLEKNVRPIKPP